jgi:hypothetical protein
VNLQGVFLTEIVVPQVSNLRSPREIDFDFPLG